MTVPRLLILNSTNSYRTKDFLSAAQKFNAAVALVTNAEGGLETFASNIILNIDFKDMQNSVSAIKDYHRENPVTAIVAVDEETCILAAEASAALGISYNSCDAVKIAGNKYLFRKSIKDAGLPTPLFQILKPQTNIKEFSATSEYPCVLKPLDRSASQGVIRANNPSEFIIAYDRIARLLPNQDIIVEEYIPGSEVSVEGVLNNGKLTTLAIFDKPDVLDGPFFEETIYITPSNLPADILDSINRMTEQAARAIGLQEGPVHAELRVRNSAKYSNEKGPWIIELAPRSIGGLCSRSLVFTSNLTLEEIIIANALHHPLPPYERDTLHSGVMMIPIPKSGILKRVNGELDARATKNICGLDITIKPGNSVIAWPEGNKYLGFIFAKSRTRPAVEKALRTAHKFLNFEIV